MVMAWRQADQSVTVAANHGMAFTMYRARLQVDGRETDYSTSVSPRLLASPTVNTAQIQNNSRDEYVSALLSAIFFGIFALLAILLLAAGGYLLQSNPKGIPLHWVYVAVKAPLCVVAAGGDFLAHHFQTQTPLDFPLGTPLALVGFLYPFALGIALCSETFRSRKPRPVADSYTLGLDEPRPGLFAAIGTISTCVACLSLLVGAFYEFVAVIAMFAANRTNALLYDREAGSALFAAIVFALDFVPAILLLVGANQILKSNPRGIATHGVYAVVKVITALLGAIAVWKLLSDSEVFFPTPIALIPNLLALIYPIALLNVLRNYRGGVQPTY